MTRLLPIALLVLVGRDAFAQDAGLVDGGVYEEESAEVEPREPEAAPGEQQPAVEADPASEPPKVAPEPAGPNTSLSGSWTSEIFLTQRARMRSLGNGRYGVRTENVYPFYNTLTLRADEVGHEGLSIHFQGWAGLDLADVYFDQRFVADPNYFYLQFRDFGLDARAGRQVVFSGAARGLHLDGVNVSYETPVHLGIQGIGGLLVTPRHGPDWYRDEVGEDYGDFGAGFSDWEREGELGDWAAGGRLFYRRVGLVSAGLSFVHISRLGETESQLAGADLDLTPAKWIELGGDAVLAAREAALKEANLGVDVRPHDLFSFGVDYRHADPTLYISRMSIFSVFSSEKYDSVGGTVRFHLLTWLHLFGGYHHHFYRFYEDNVSEETGEGSLEAALDDGFEAAAGLRAASRASGGVALLEFRKLKQDLDGMNQLRVGGSMPLGSTGLAAHTDLYLDIYDEAHNSQNLGLLGDVGLHWKRDQWRVGGAFTAGVTPFAEHELRGMIKASYCFALSFRERRRP